MRTPRILVIDDQYGRSDIIRTAFLRAAGLSVASPRYEVTFCSGQVEGVNSLDLVLEAIRAGWPPGPESRFWSLVLLDVQFESSPPGSEDEEFGIIALRAIRRTAGLEGVPVVMLTEREGVRRKAGANMADGFLPKSELSPSALDRRVWRHGLIEDDRPEGGRLVGGSRDLLEALRSARLYALDQLGSVTVFGQTGTGKSELARYVHQWSRRDGSFVKWTAEAKEAGIAKAELLGWWRGGHGQADHSQAGEMEKAHRGTFFLDEVAYLSPELQGLLIDVRRRDADGHRTIRRMGTMPRRDSRSETVRQALESVVGEMEMENRRGREVPTGRVRLDVLFVSATNVDLWDEEKRRSHAFRVDLLNDLGPRIRMPALNEQRADIPCLFRELVAVARRRQADCGESDIEVPAETLEYLISLDWTDKNVVTLKAIAEAAVSALGPDFGVLQLPHVRDAAHRLRSGLVEDAGASPLGVIAPRRSWSVSDCGPPMRVPELDASYASEVLPTSGSEDGSRSSGAVDGPKEEVVETSVVSPLGEGPATRRLVNGQEPVRGVTDLIEVIEEMRALAIPADQEVLDGVLPRLQEEYARLVLRMFGAALLATKRSGGTSTLEAVRLLLGRAELRPGGRGDATKAYDVVKRLILFGDTTFARRAAKGCPVLSQDELVKEHVGQAIRR